LIPRDYIIKLRALYQRRKGRDLFDIDLGLQHPSLDRHRLVTAFLRYMDHGGHQPAAGERQPLGSACRRRTRDGWAGVAPA
jgi:predicted nucleotidyltransferase component of viral defense system